MGKLTDTEPGDRPISERLLQGIRNMWQNDSLVDFILEVEGRSFRVHKVVLASVSDYFLAMVTGGLAETNSSSVCLQGVTAAGIEPLLQFIYTDNLPVTHDNVCDVLMAAAHLQIQSAVTRSARYIANNIDVDTCVNILNLSHMYSLKSLEKVAYEFVLRNFPAVVQCGQYLEMQVEDLVMVVGSPDLIFGPEYELLKCIQMWLNHNREERMEHAGRLARHIRFRLMSLAEIKQSVTDMAYLEKDFLCAPVVEKAVQYHSLSVHARVLDDTPANTIRGTPSIVGFLCRSDGHRVSPQCHVYRAEQDDWLRLPDVEPITSSAAVACINNYMVVCGGRVLGEPTNKCYIYDPRHQVWASLEPMLTTRSHFPLVVVNDSLYAMAGFVTYSRDACGLYDKMYNTDSVEKFSFETGKWEHICCFPSKVRDMNACVYGGKIYAAAGMDEDWRSPRNVIQMDVDSATFRQKAPLPVHPSTCTDSRMVTVRHHIDLYLIVATGNGSAIYEYMHALDQWSSIPMKIDVEGGLPVCLPHSTEIYVINGTQLAADQGQDVRVVKEHVCGKFAVHRKHGVIRSVNHVSSYPFKCHDLNCAILTLPWHLTHYSGND